MQPAVVKALIVEIRRLYSSQQTKPHVVFHGGEPLLYGIKQLGQLIASLVQYIPEVSLSIQTNGTIYNDILEKLILDYRSNLAFSVSVDGPQLENDRHRLDLRGRSVYSKIETNLRRAMRATVLDNILMVADIRNDPVRIYQFMLDTGAKSYNILLQDGDHDHLPPGKSNIEDTEVGNWLWRLFKLYCAGKQQFRLKFFDDISVSLLKKARGIKSPASTYSLCTITIDTDGEIKQADTFRINRNSADRLTGSNILDSSLLNIANSSSNKKSLHKSERLSKRCVDCCYLDVCGGGFPSHRAKGSEMQHPSIYCSDYIYLFERIEATLCH